MKKLFLTHKDGTTQEVELVYGPYMIRDDDFGVNPYPEYLRNVPIATVRVVGVALEKSWSFRDVRMIHLKNDLRTR